MKVWRYEGMMVSRRAQRCVGMWVCGYDGIAVSGMRVWRCKPTRVSGTSVAGYAYTYLCISMYVHILYYRIITVSFTHVYIYVCMEDYKQISPRPSTAYGAWCLCMMSVYLLHSLSPSLSFSFPSPSSLSTCLFSLMRCSVSPFPFVSACCCCCLQRVVFTQANKCTCCVKP